MEQDRRSRLLRLVLRQLRLLAAVILVVLLVIVGTASALIAYSMATRTAIIVGFNNFDLAIEPPDTIEAAYLGAHPLSAPYRPPDKECYEYDNKALMVGRVYFGMLSCTSWQADTTEVPWSPVTPSPAPIPTNTNVPT